MEDASHRNKMHQLMDEKNFNTLGILRAGKRAGEETRLSREETRLSQCGKGCLVVSWDMTLADAGVVLREKGLREDCHSQLVAHS